MGALESVGDHWKKKLAQNRFQASSSGFYILRQLSTQSGSNGADGGGNKPGVPQTSSMRVPHNSHSTDMVESIHTDNSRTRNPDSRTRNPDNQIRFQPPQHRLKSERQNAARESRQIHLPPMQSREVFSRSFPFFVLLFCEG